MFYNINTKEKHYFEHFCVFRKGLCFCFAQLLFQNYIAFVVFIYFFLLFFFFFFSSVAFHHALLETEWEQEQKLMCSMCMDTTSRERMLLQHIGPLLVFLQ